MQSLATKPRGVTATCRGVSAVATIAGGDRGNLTEWNNIWSTSTAVYSPFFEWSAIAGGPFLSFGQTFA